MEEFINQFFGSYAALVLSVIGVCAALAALLPAPSNDSNAVYKVVYKILNFLAANIGKAKNASDVNPQPAGEKRA